MTFLFTMGMNIVVFLFKDPAIATSKLQGNLSYGSYDRGTAKKAWVTESDGKTPLVGEVRFFGVVLCVFLDFIFFE